MFTWDSSPRMQDIMRLVMHEAPRGKKEEQKAPTTTVHKAQVEEEVATAAAAALPRTHKKTQVSVTPEDTLDCVQRLILQSTSDVNKDDGGSEKKKRKVAALNMANPHKPGLDCRTTTQEEEILKRTNAFQALLKRFYPIPSDTLLYSTGVTCFCDAKYAALQKEQRFQFDLITACAYQYTFTPAMLPPEEYQGTLRLVRTIFRVAAQAGVTHLVLGAFGCGAFQNPREDIICIFNTVLAEYNGVFEEVVFAVYDSASYYRGMKANFPLFLKGILGQGG